MNAFEAVHWINKQSISHHASYVLLQLAVRAARSGKCRPSRARLAADCKVSEATVKRALSELIDEGYITRSKRAVKATDGSSTAEYQVLKPLIRSGADASERVTETHASDPARVTETHASDPARVTETHASDPARVTQTRSSGHTDPLKANSEGKSSNHQIINGDLEGGGACEAYRRRLADDGFPLTQILSANTLTVLQGWSAAGVSNTTIDQALTKARLSLGGALPKSPAYLGPIVSQILEEQAHGSTNAGGCGGARRYVPANGSQGIGHDLAAVVAAARPEA